MMMERISVQLKNKLSELERISQILEELGKLHHLPSKALYGVNLALEEILTNVISYGYEDKNEHEIIVRLSLQNGELVTEVEDGGRAFNPLELPEPDMNSPLEERPIGGLGIHFVRELMDAVEYSRKDGKNLLVMKKKTKGGLKMEMTQSKKEKLVILGLKGKLDANTSNSLEEKLLSLIEGGEKQIVVDFSHLDYISSAGLRVILMAAKRLKNANGKIVLCALNENVREVFDLAGFSTIFSIYPSQQEASQALQ